MAIITVVSKGVNKSIESSLTTNQALQLLAGSTSNFAQDLVRQAQTRRGLSPTQTNWVIFMAQENLDRARQEQARPKTQLGDFARLTALFARAQENGLSRPRIRLALPDGAPVILDIVGSGANAGKLRVTNGLPRDDGRSRFYGFVSPDGSYDGRNPEVAQLLVQFAADPAAVAAQYGKSSGDCCFCGIALSNGDSGSVSVGYGPICAGRYELPWEPNGRGYEFGQGQPVLPAQDQDDQPSAPAAREPVPLSYEGLLARAAAGAAEYAGLATVAL